MATIIVMDDEAPIRALLSTALQSAGYTVVEASSGNEGIWLCRQQPVDVAIVDIVMPDLKGPDVILELTRTFLNIKVIAMSGVFSDDLLKKMANLLGVRQTLHKPFPIDNLIKAVRYELMH